MSFMERMNSFHLDILKEIGNIGAGNAATALSLLVNRKIDMSVPSARIVTFKEMMELAGGADEPVCAVFLRIEGDAPGSMYFILSIDQADLFVQSLTSSDYSFHQTPYDEMAMSALQEMGNILAGSYLSALSDFTSLSLMPSVPAVNVDMFGALMSFGLYEVSKESDQCIVIETLITDSSKMDKAVKGYFFLLPDPDSFEIIFQSLGVQE